MSDKVTIESAKKTFKNQGTIVKDSNVFKPQHVPSEIHHRGNQMNCIIKELSKFLDEGGINQMKLYGGNSTGKTLLLRWLNQSLDKILEDHYRYEYKIFNCSQSDWQSLSVTIANELDISGVRRGSSKQKTFKNILQGLNSSKKYIFAFDEFDKLNKKSKKAMALFISRPHEQVNSTDIEIPDIFNIISGNKPTMITDLDKERSDRTFSSSFNPEPVKFPKYTGEELEDIFHQRFKEGISSEYYTFGNVSYLAGIVKKKLSGDIRMGLKAINKTTEIFMDSDRDKITDKMIEKAVDRIIKEELESIVSSLSAGLKEVLYAMCEFYNKYQEFDGGKEISVDSIYMKYKKIFDKKHKQTIRNRLRKLSNTSLVDRKRGSDRAFYYYLEAPYSYEMLDEYLNNNVFTGIEKA